MLKETDCGKAAGASSSKTGLQACDTIGICYLMDRARERLGYYASFSGGERAQLSV